MAGSEALTGVIAANVRSVRERIAVAAARAGRDPEEIVLIGAAKQQPTAVVVAAIEAGLRDVGENYIQEARERYEAIGRQVRWHFIGHLQSNKARFAVDLFDPIHSVDRLSLALELDKRAGQRGRTVEVLLEVNLAGEETKSGVAPEGAADLASAVAEMRSLRLCGLMAMPPFFDDPEESRPYFRQLRELRDRICSHGVRRETMSYLSMGMSNDFEVAVEEGATHVRVGTALFGPRT